MFQFDHFIHYVDCPEQAMEELKLCGLHAVMGGRHENHGTYNSLCYFNLSYIELLSTFDKKLMTEKADPYSLRETILQSEFSQGGQRTALRTNNIAAVAKHFQTIGYDTYGPVDFSRTRPDGALVIWKLLFVGRKDETPILPFFIEWEQKDEARSEELQTQGTIAPHPLGNVTLTNVGYVTKDLHATIRTWQTALQVDVSDVFIDESLQAEAQTLYITGGNITFYQPIAAGRAQTYLQENGEKPFLIELTNEDRTEDIVIRGVTYRLKQI